MEIEKPIRPIDLYPVIQVMGWNKLVKRTLLTEHDITFVEGVLYEDQLWCMKLLFASEEIIHIKDATYVYRIRPNSIMQSAGTIRNLESYIRFLEGSEEQLSIHIAEMNPKRLKKIWETIDKRRIPALKLLIRLNEIPLTQKITYLKQIKNCERRIVINPRELPLFSQMVSYTLWMPSYIGFSYLWLLNKLPHRGK